MSMKCYSGGIDLIEAHHKECIFMGGKGFIFPGETYVRPIYAERKSLNIQDIRFTVCYHMLYRTPLVSLQRKSREI